MYTDFKEFFKNYISIVAAQVPNYKSLLPDASLVHPLMNRLDPDQVSHVNKTIRNIIKIPDRVVLVYNPTMYTFYSRWDKIDKKMIIGYPTVTYYMIEYPKIIEAAMKHEIGHIANGDCFIGIPGHSECVNVAMDARINMNIEHQDLDYLSRCLAFNGEQEGQYVNAEKWYKEILLPTLEGGYSWQIAHSQYHNFDDPCAGGKCPIHAPSGTPKGEDEEGEDVRPSDFGGNIYPEDIDKIIEALGEKPGAGMEAEEETDGDGDKERQKDGDKRGEKQGDGGIGEKTKDARRKKALLKKIEKTIDAINKLKENY